MKTVTLLLATVAAVCHAQVPLPGRCPDKDVVQNFDVNRYLGKWYEQERYFFVFEIGGECVTATYTDEGNGTVGVLNEQFNSLTRRNSGISGTANLVGSNDEAKLEVRFSMPVDIPAPYWVLATDYDNYAIVWSCVDARFAHFEFAWVLTREQNPGSELQATIRDEIENQGLRRELLRRTPQNCADN